LISTNKSNFNKHSDMKVLPNIDICMTSHDIIY